MQRSRPNPDQRGNEADLAELEARNIRGHVALGREGRKHAAVDRDRRPATYRMGEHLATVEGRAAYAERKWLSEVPNGWIKEALGWSSLRFAGPETGAGRMVAGLPCTEPSANGDTHGGLKVRAAPPGSVAHRNPR